MPTVTALKSMFQEQIAPGRDAEFLRLLTEADMRLTEYGRFRWTRRKDTLTPINGYVTLPTTYASILGARIGKDAVDIRDEDYEFVPGGPGEVPLDNGFSRLIDQGMTSIPNPDSFASARINSEGVRNTFTLTAVEAGEVGNSISFTIEKNDDAIGITVTNLNIVVGIPDAPLYRTLEEGPPVSGPDVEGQHQVTSIECEGTITSSGDVSFLAGGFVEYLVPVLNGDTSEEWAEKVLLVLQADDVDYASEFDWARSGSTILATRKDFISTADSLSTISNGTTTGVTPTSEVLLEEAIEPVESTPIDHVGQWCLVATEDSGVYDTYQADSEQTWTATELPEQWDDVANAQALIALLNSLPATSALVTAAPVGNVTGSLSPFDRRYLYGGENTEYRRYKVAGHLDDDDIITALMHFAPVTLMDPSITDIDYPADATTNTRCPDATALKLMMLGILMEEAHDQTAARVYISDALRGLDNKEQAQRGNAAKTILNRPAGRGVMRIRGWR